MTETQLQPSVPRDAVVTAADVVVGIATYNNADAIAHALEAVEAACGTVDATCAIVHADGCSTDGTPERAAEVAPSGAPIMQIEYPLDAVDRMAGPYRDVPAKGRAVRAIFETAKRLGARACAVVDVEADQYSQGWLDALVRPILAHDRDFVAPYYTRHQFGGMINSGLVYPLTRSLYGKRVRYPMGGDFACSMRLIDRCLGESVWDSDLVKSAVDLWLTTRALTDGSRVAQAMVGVKHQTWKEVSGDSTGPLARMLAAVFDGADRWQTVWQKVRGSEKVQTFGVVDVIDDAAVTVNVHREIESFRIAQRNLDEIWKLILPPRTMLDLKKLAVMPEGDFRMPDDVWARIVYDFALAYHQRTLNREHVLSAIAPLFAGWVASFVTEMQSATLAESEERLDRMCLRFESEKPYLISRWRWPDRFSP